VKGYALAMPAPATVVIATRNRWANLERTLTHLTGLPEQPEIVVVDNGSTDGTPARVRAGFPGVRLIPLPVNRGASARTVGARLAETPVVAWSDDDSWWEPGGVDAVARTLEEDPVVALAAATVLVGPDRQVDPACLAMAGGARRHGRYRQVSGFLACAAAGRRPAVLAAGGFDPDLLIGGEEELLSLDLAAAGWKLVHQPDAVVCHWPSPQRDATGRRRLEVAHALLVGWHRLPWPSALARTARLAGASLRRPRVAPAFGRAARLAGWAAGGRQVVPAKVAAAHLADERAFRRSP